MDTSTKATGELLYGLVLHVLSACAAQDNPCIAQNESCRSVSTQQSELTHFQYLERDVTLPDMQTQMEFTQLQ